jgi:hypothetical protein
MGKWKRSSRHFKIDGCGYPNVPVRGLEARWGPEPVWTLWRSEKSLALPGNERAHTCDTAMRIRQAMKNNVFASITEAASKPD